MALKGVAPLKKYAILHQSAKLSTTVAFREILILL